MHVEWLIEENFPSGFYQRIKAYDTQTGDEGGHVMKATINREGCISCELCASTCPKVFRMAEDGLAEVYVDEIPQSEEDAAIEAQEGCPVSVITVE